MSKWLKEMRIQYNKFDTEKFIKKSIQIWENDWKKFIKAIKILQKICIEKNRL